MTTSAERCGGVVVTWIRHHGRSERLADRAGLRAVFMPWARPRRPWWHRPLSWTRSARRTWQEVRALPAGAVVVAVSPPVFNPLACLAASGGTRPVVLDAHSGTFNDARWAWSHRLVRACARRCAAVIVTNTEVARGVLGPDIPLVVLHDPLLDLSANETSDPPPHARPYVVFPASGAPDEPLDAVVEAAVLLAGDVDVLVTGRFASTSDTSRVQFTGYLPEDQYRTLLRGADAVLALTTRDGTTQRAAYEAVEVGARLVCSDTATLRDTFGDAVEYCDNNGSDLAAAVRRACARSRDESHLNAQLLRRRLNAQGAAALALLARPPRRDRSSATG